MKKLALAAAAAVALISAAAHAAPAGWSAYTIRGAPDINENYLGQPNDVQFVVNGSGPGGSDKAGLGTDALNGGTIGQIDTLSINRIDDYTRFAGNQGAYYGPYMNIWVRDAQGDYAVLANEPSNTEWAGTSEWNTSGANLLTKTVKVFEQEGDFDLPAGLTWGMNGFVYNGANQALFSDFAGYEISAPPASFLTANEPLGSGAPRDISTFQGYGFNWVFGDTGANYTGDSTGYIVGSPVATLVPEPTTLAAVAAGAVALLGRRRRKA